MAITVSMGALGATLAYFGYNNYIAKTDKVGGGVINNPDQLVSRSDVPSPRNKIEPVYDSTTACLQSGGKTTQATPVVESAKQEVAKEVEKEWGQFWKGGIRDTARYKPRRSTRGQLPRIILNKFE